MAQKLWIAAFTWVTLHPVWATLHPKSYAAPSELCCTLLSYAAFNWATPHLILAMLRPMSYAAPSELSCNLLSYAVPAQINIIRSFTFFHNSASRVFNLRKCMVRNPPKFISKHAPNSFENWSCSLPLSFHNITNVPSPHSCTFINLSVPNPPLFLYVREDR